MEDKIKAFVEAWDALRREYYAKHYTNLTAEPLEIKIGKRWVKVTEAGHSVMAFIDPETGDIYKPASWAAPAKHVRGNIDGPHHGMGAVDGPHSIRYLR